MWSVLGSEPLNSGDVSSRASGGSAWNSLERRREPTGYEVDRSHVSYSASEDDKNVWTGVFLAK